MIVRCRAFTLIELLVVVAILAVLVGILLPSLSAARSEARKVKCKALLRHYVLATEFYAHENNGYLMDAYTYLDPERGLARYWGGGGEGVVLSEKLTRCPDDFSTESLGRAGPVYRNVAVDAAGALDWVNPVYEPLNVKCSIGGNENTLSASGRATSSGPSPMWVRQNDFLEFAPDKMGLWADWQNNPTAAEPAKIFWSASSDSGTKLGSVVFRHRGVSNVAYADGHVGEMKANFPLINNGHDMGVGAAPWSGISNHLNIGAHYPFGPRRSPSGLAVSGDLPGVSFW